MLRGISNLNHDDKGRFAVPTRYRDLLDEASARRVIVTVSYLHRCLWIYPLNEWEPVEEAVRNLPTTDRAGQRMKHLVLGYATDIDMDKSGRLLLPAELREYAGLDKHVTLLGQANKFELWDDAAWKARLAEMEQEAVSDNQVLSPEVESIAL